MDVPFEIQHTTPVATIHSDELPQSEPAPIVIHVSDLKIETLNVSVDVKEN